MSATLSSMPVVNVRRLIALVALVLVAGAIAATAVRASQTVVRTQVMGNGTLQVTGYDGGAALNPAG